MRVIPWEEMRDSKVKAVVQDIEDRLRKEEDDIALRVLATSLDRRGLHESAKRVRRIADQMEPMTEEGQEQ